MKHDITLCLIANRYLEGDYIEEWCEYNYSIGFDFIYILEDLNGRDLKFIDMPYIKDKVDKGLMIIQQIPHINMHELYPKFYNEHKSEFNWCAVFDADEFLVLNKHKDVHEFVNDPMYKDADVITINWRNYGDNGKTHKEDGLVRERFTVPAPYRDKVETKIIVRGGLEHTNFFISHCCIVNNNATRTVFCNGEQYTALDPFHKTDYSVASLDHYGSKSTEEFIRRKSVGRLDIPSRSFYTVLKNDFMPAYYSINERTTEKEKMFEEALNALINK